MSVLRSYIGRRERASLRRLRRIQVDDIVGGLEDYNHNHTTPYFFLIIPLPGSLVSSILRDLGSLLMVLFRMVRSHRW